MSYDPELSVRDQDRQFCAYWQIRERLFPGDKRKEWKQADTETQRQIIGEEIFRLGENDPEQLVNARLRYVGMSITDFALNGHVNDQANMDSVDIPKEV
jgi:hypothetical protein